MTAETEGRVRPLFGLYRETSSVAEFQDALRLGYPRESEDERPHWFEAGQAVERTPRSNVAAAMAFGARWYATCDADGSASVTELPARMVDWGDRCAIPERICLAPGRSRMVDGAGSLPPG